MTPGVTTCYLECFPLKVAVCYTLLMCVTVFIKTVTAKLQAPEHTEGSNLLYKNLFISKLIQVV